MKYDVIIGNPPYNKALVKERHSCYNHEAMNMAKQGHIGFYITCLEKLKKDGVVSFVTPASFLTGASFYNTRKWLFNNYNVEYITYYNSKDIFPTVMVDTLITIFIRNNGPTQKIKFTNSNNETWNINPFDLDSLVIPNYPNILYYNLYKKLNKFDKISVISNKSNGYSFTNKKYFSDKKTKKYEYIATVGVNVDKAINMFTSINKPASNKWMVTAKKKRASNFCVIPPKSIIDDTMIIIEFDTENEANTFVTMSNSKMFRDYKTIFFDSLGSTYLKNLPFIKQELNSINEIYDYFGLTEEEKNYFGDCDEI